MRDSYVLALVAIIYVAPTVPVEIAYVTAGIAMVASIVIAWSEKKH